jgi:serine/threonine protein kinase
MMCLDVDISSEKKENSTSNEESENNSISSWESLSDDDNIDQEENLNLQGKILRNYNIIYELGRGSYSIVWLAYNISDEKFYAIKVQNPSEYKDGLNEIKFVKRLVSDPPIFNNILESFVEEVNAKKYLCSIWRLHSDNIDGLIRKGGYSEGLPLDVVKKIMKQLIISVNILHKKYKVFHGDIKTDNILIKGINNRDKFMISKYKQANFKDEYLNAKKIYWVNTGKNLNSIDKMNIKTKRIIREKIHGDIIKKILLDHKTEYDNINSHIIDNDYLNNINISLADFGTYCEENDYYEEQFGTRYYFAPEIILMGKCKYPVDIWAIGCTFYELLSGKFLFDPIKTKDYNRDYWHLSLICDTCGIFSKKFITNTKYYKKYFTSNAELINYDRGEESRLDRKINELKLDQDISNNVKRILKGTLQIDPCKRWTIDDLTKELFFDH